MTVRDELWTPRTHPGRHLWNVAVLEAWRANAEALPWHPDEHAVQWLVFLRWCAARDNLGQRHCPLGPGETPCTET
jgi:hypothetical protein